MASAQAREKESLLALRASKIRSNELVEHFPHSCREVEWSERHRRWRPTMAKEHTKNARPFTEEKHQKGKGRRNRDADGEKED